MLRACFAIPGDLQSPTGGYEYARRLLRLIPGLAHLALPAGFPDPSEAELTETARLLAAVPQDAVLLVDGLAFGALPTRSLAFVKAPIVALVHHPLCLEAGLSPRRAARLHAGESAALALAQRVIATSNVTARWLASEFAISPGRLSVAEPGTTRHPQARGSEHGTTRLLAVGAVTPRKGYDVLVEALAGLHQHDWHLTIAGDLSRDTACVSALRTAIAAHRLTDRITLTGAVADPELDALYAAADLFVSASRHEGYGMAVASAMAHGLPLVATTAGALAETIPPGASIACPAGDVDALRQAITAMLANTSLRRSCAETSWRAGQDLPDWRYTAEIVATVLASV